MLAKKLTYAGLEPVHPDVLDHSASCSALGAKVSCHPDEAYAPSFRNESQSSIRNVLLRCCT